MSIKMAVGGEFFDQIRQAGSYYIDKTELIYDLVHEADNKVTLFTRPRRFGKTLMMSMIENFLIYAGAAENCLRGWVFRNMECFAKSG